MFKILGENYYIDMDAVDEYVQFTSEVVEKTKDDEDELREIEVNPIDGIIIDYFEEEDSYKTLKD
jgi:hypothetical protein